MKKLVLLVMAAVLIISLGCNSLPEWQNYESKEGWFRVQFPGNPKEEKIPVSKDQRTFEIHIIGVELKNVAYAVSYYDVTEEEESTLDYDTLARRTFAPMGATNYSMKDIELDGYAGKEAEGSIKIGSTDGLARFRFYIVDGRIFTLNAAGKSSLLNSDNTNKFFDSFQLLDEE